jgi:hypothetical protein
VSERKIERNLKKFQNSPKKKEEVAGSRRKEGEMSTKPRKYLICMKMNKGKMVNTFRVKRPKYSLKVKSTQLFENSNGKSVILIERLKYPANRRVDKGKIVMWKSKEMRKDKISLSEL